MEELPLLSTAECSRPVLYRIQSTKYSGKYVCKEYCIVTATDIQVPRCSCLELDIM